MALSKLERKEVVIRAARRLLEVPQGEVISLATLSAAAGVDVSEHRWIIQAAMKAVNSEFGCVFATVRKEGYRRLERSEGTLFASDRGLRQIRRRARVAAGMATNAAKYANDLSADQRRQHNQRIAALGLIGHLSMSRTVQTMPDADTPQTKPDPLAELREALGM